MEKLALERQNEEASLKLLAVKDLLYTGSAQWSHFLYVTSLMPIFFQIIKVRFPLLSNWEVYVSLFSLIAVIGVDKLIKKRFEKATLLAEEFDTALFGLNWHDDLYGSKISPEERHRIALSIKKIEGYKNWYSPESLTEIPRNIAILLCQRQNTRWDMQQKRRFANFLTCLFVISAIGVIGLGLYFQDILFYAWFISILFPAAAFMVKTWTLNQSFSNTASKQTTLAADIDSALEEFFASRRVVSVVRLRRFQDRIFEYRKENIIVPGWLYRRFKTTDQQVASMATQELVNKVKLRNNE